MLCSNKVASKHGHINQCGILAVMHVWNPKWSQRPRRSVIRCEGISGMLIVHISRSRCEGLRTRTDKWLLNSKLVQASNWHSCMWLFHNTPSTEYIMWFCGRRPKSFGATDYGHTHGRRPHTHHWHTRRSPTAFLMLVWKNDDCN